MVDGVEVTSFVKLPDDAKKSMSIVAAADYLLSFKAGYEDPLSPDNWRENIQKYFWNQDSFVITKKTKKSEREVDLKPLVYRFEAQEGENGAEFFLQVSTGSVDNIKPELVLSSLFDRCGIAYDENAIQIHRLEVYGRESESELKPLYAYGEEI
jgi:radical SAM-linked protein